jgi:hypothetical protein
MPAKRLKMQKIKEILHLRYEVRLSYRGIHQALNIGYGTVVDYLQRAKVAGGGFQVGKIRRKIRTPIILEVINK